MASCTEDFKDWADPMSNSENGKSAKASVVAVEAIDLTAVNTDSIQLFTPTYTMEDGVTATNVLAIYGEDVSNAVSLNTDEYGRVKASELRDAIEKLYGVTEGAFNLPFSVTTRLTDNGQTFSYDNPNLSTAINMAAGMYLSTADGLKPMSLYDGAFTITVPAQDIRFYFLPFDKKDNAAEERLGSTEETFGLLMNGSLVKGAEAHEIFFEGDDEYTEYVIKMNPTAMTYEVEGVVQADPALWYMVGNCIGSNDWDNGAQSVGTGLIPLLPVPGADLTVDGGTTLAYAGYFPAGGQFKFVKTPGDWGEQMNFTNIENPDMTIVSDLDGDNHNIGINTAGYYKITMNTIEKKVTIEKYTDAVSIFLTITMPGDYQGWDAAGTPMTAMGKRANTETHDWFLDAEYSTDANLKFANGTWDINWGATDFPMGYGTQGGPNIPVAAGSYRVFFNDILGLYYFQPK